MKTLITGGAGFIGSHLHKLYPDADIVDRANGQDICEELPDKDYDQIFHLAAKHHIPTCEKEPEETIKINCWGTLKLIKQYPNARILSMSSSAANEIKSVYGLSKLFTEYAGKLHKNFLAIRLYNVFGEGQTVAGGAFVPKLIEHMVHQKPLTVYGDGKQSRDFTYVGDVVENLRILMNTSNTGLVHVGYGEPISINNLVKMVYGYPPPMTHAPARGVDILYSKSPTPCKVFYGRSEGIKRTIAWARLNDKA